MDIGRLCTFTDRVAGSFSPKTPKRAQKPNNFFSRSRVIVTLVQLVGHFRLGVKAQLTWATSCPEGLEGANQLNPIP